MKKLLILGAGGYGKTIADIAAQLQCYDSIAFLDDTKENTPGVLGNCADFVRLADENTEVYPAFGNNEARMTWLNRILDSGVQAASLVHPDAYVSPTAVLGTGTAVLPKAVVNTGSVVKNGCIVNIGALIDHDVILEEGSHAAPGAIIKADNRIPAGVKIEAGSVIENRQYPR